jgi:hypothetical protein
MNAEEVGWSVVNKGILDGLFGVRQKLACHSVTLKMALKRLSVILCAKGRAIA